MNNVLSLISMKSAQENQELIIRCQRENMKNFLYMAIAMFQIREYRQFEALGYKTIDAFIASPHIVVSKGQFNGLANVARMLQWVNTTEDELLACGYTSCMEVARLARSYGDAEINREKIASLLTRRSKGLIDHARLVKEVAEILGTKSKAKADKPAPVQTLDSTLEDDSSDDTATESATDWRKELLTELARAVAKGKDRADAAALILDILAGE